MIFVIIGAVFIAALIGYVVYTKFINKYFAITNRLVWFLVMIVIPVTCFILGPFFLVCGLLG